MHFLSSLYVGFSYILFFFIFLTLFVSLFLFFLISYTDKKVSQKGKPSRLCSSIGRWQELIQAQILPSKWWWKCRWRVNLSLLFNICYFALIMKKTKKGGCFFFECCRLLGTWRIYISMRGVIVKEFLQLYWL